MVNKQLLTNNVMLISEPIAQSSTVAIGFWFSIGSRSETKDCRGITHFTEHLIFKGTATKSTHDIACIFDRIGGYINAYTEKEAVCVYCVVPYSKENFRIALETLCDIAENATFPEEEVERERIVVENEITAVSDDPEESALDYVSSSIWPSQTISQTIAGSIKDVESLGREQIKSWYEKHFVGGELRVSVAGCFDGDVLVKILSSLQMHKKPVNYPEQKHYDEKPSWHSGFFYKRSPFNQTQVFALYPYHVPVTEKENYILSVFNAITGDTMSSRLFEALREKSGYCYNVYSFFSIYEDAVAWCAYASSDRKNGGKVLKLLEKELQNLMESPITDEEVEEAKLHLAGEETINSEDVEYCMKRNQRNYSMGFKLLTKEEAIKTIMAVTKDDIQNLVYNLVKNKDRAEVYYGKGLSFNEKRKHYAE